MNRNTIFFCFAIFFINTLSAQENVVEGWIITSQKDTIEGKIKRQNLFNASKVTLTSKNVKVKVYKRKISQVKIGDETYIKAKNFWFNYFYKKELTGNVNLYSFKNSFLLGAFDSDINFGRLKPALMFYCDDLPNFLNRIKKIDKNNIHSFIKEYNDWKAKNPNSLSTYEKQIHEKEKFNIKASYFLPGIGFEIGTGDKSSINLMLKTSAGYNRTKGAYLEPHFDGQFRFYYNTSKRIANNKRTYNRTGKYLALATIIQEERGVIGFEHGWQLTSGKNRYDNLSVGIGTSPSFDLFQTNWSFFLLFDYDIGYIL